MLKLKELQKKKSKTEGITIKKFDICKNEWIELNEVQFEVTKQHFVEVGFRREFKVSSDDILFQNKSWVLNMYHESLKKIIDELGTDAECQTRKAIQIHCVSRHLAFTYEQLCNSNFDLFGLSFSYSKIYCGLYGSEHVTIEEYIDGEFTKYDKIDVL